MSGQRTGMLLAVLSFIGGLAAPAAAQSLPSVGSVQMPLVSPEQASQYFATRVVPPSDAPALTPSASSAAQSLQSVNVDPILGHDLPTDAMSPVGLPRADFATAKPGAEKTKRAVTNATALGARAPGAVIHQQPPTIGKP